jgi:hypothetical protein
MRKLFLGALIIATLGFGVAAQQETGNTNKQGDIPNMGHAPVGSNGIGRLDARVFDEVGQPVPGVFVKLDSNRTDGFFCESWNTTDEHGVAVLPPIHMGSLKLMVKAKGYEPLKLVVDPQTLGQPLHITLKKSS